MYKVILPEQLPNPSQYKWFGSFANPCYGFDVKVDVTKLVAHGKAHGTKFFVNTLYLVTKALSSVDAFRMRYVGGEIRLYDVINPTFTVMTDFGEFENAGFAMVDDYQGFYDRACSVLEQTSHQTMIKETYNDSANYDDFYITCIPWLSYEGMTHPLPNNNPESSSVPRICWDKYRIEGDRIVMNLNITVSHCFVDGKRLCEAFAAVQRAFDNCETLLR